MKPLTMMAVGAIVLLLGFSAADELARDERSR
jgi:hypothetical protein